MSEAADKFSSLISAAEAGDAMEWNELASAMQEASDSHTELAEQLFIKVVRLNIKIPLAPDSELPNAMSPEEMLKSEAIQALVKWTGPKYRADFGNALAAAESPALVAIIRSQLRNL